MKENPGKEALSQEVQRLRQELEEARAVLHAIHHHQVDALVVAKPEGNAVYTLQGANRTYRILIETLNEGTVIVSADGTILFCNSRFVDMVKESSFAVIGSSMVGFLASGEKALFTALLEQGMRDSARGESRLKAKDGSTVPVYLSLNSLQMEEMQGACLIATDLTEQKRNEEIVAAGQLAQTILDQAAHVIVVCDEAGWIIKTSRRAHALCSQNPIFQHFDAMFKLEPDGGAGPGTTETAAEKAFSIATVLEGKAVKGQQMSLVNGNRRYHLLVNAGPLFSSQDRIIGAVVTLTDVTEIHEAQEKLRRAHDELELRVEERTAELTAVNQELQEFAFIASHDLQEPLRKIQSFGDRLAAKQAAVLSPEGKDYLARMQKAARRMRGLIEDLLSYSRIKTQAQPFASVDLAGVVREVIEDLEVRVEQVGAQVIVEWLPVIEADFLQMRQLFQNLIGNALKFHGKEKPLVQIRGEFLEGSGQCRITVEDNGIGFDEQYLERIFTPFQRLHGRSAYEGTGMGLAICKRIVDRHKGDIKGKSKPGAGAVFIVQLPVKQSGDAPNERSE